MGAEFTEGGIEKIPKLSTIFCGIMRKNAWGCVLFDAPMARFKTGAVPGTNS
jgi:hypothetical protein